MHRKKLIFTSFVMILLIILSTEIAYADETSRWDDMLSSANIKQIDIIDKEAVKCSKNSKELKSIVKAFDVNRDRIVMVFHEGIIEGFQLGIFDTNARCIKSFDLHVPGRTCGVAMHGENIVLFPDSNYATEITQNVEIVCMYKIQEQTMGAIDEIATRSIEKKGDDTYYVSLSKKIPYKNISSFPSTYLIRQGPSGEKEILYDSSQYFKKIVIIWLSIFVSFGILCSIVAYFQCIKPDRKRIEAIREELRQRPVRTETDNPMDHFRRKKKDGPFEKL